MSNCQPLEEYAHLFIMLGLAVVGLLLLLVMYEFDTVLFPIG